MPADIDAFDAYMARMLNGDDLFVTSAARELAIEIVMRPPVPLVAPAGARARELHHRRAAAGRLRKQYGLSWDPLRALALRGGAEYAKRVLVPLAPERLRFVSSARAA